MSGDAPLALTDLPAPATLAALRDALDALFGPIVRSQMDAAEFEARLDEATVAVADVVLAPWVADGATPAEEVAAGLGWLSSAERLGYPPELLLGVGRR